VPLYESAAAPFIQRHVVALFNDRRDEVQIALVCVLIRYDVTHIWALGE